MRPRRQPYSRKNLNARDAQALRTIIHSLSMISMNIRNEDVKYLIHAAAGSLVEVVEYYNLVLKHRRKRDKDFQPSAGTTLPLPLE